MSNLTTRAHALSNGEYAVLVTATGGGYSALRGLAITRWQPDPHAVGDGVRIYLRDLESGAFWALCEGAACGVRVHDEQIEQWCEQDGLAVHSVLRVANERNAELRTLRIVNHSARTRRFDLTTYAELSLNTLAADAAHPAFSKLFIQTEFDEARRALIAWRRLRSPDDTPLWVAQRLTGAREYETDRARFIGRTRSVTHPLAMSQESALSGSVGTVLDPIFSLRAPLELREGETIELELLQCAAATRAELERLLDGVPAPPYAPHAAQPALGLPDEWLACVTFDLDAHEWSGPDAHMPAAEPLPRADYGSFSEDGREYIIEVGRDLQPTPQPWINVIANEQFGFLVSETGAGYTWAANSRENRITPWSNDPVADPHTEPLIIRDDDDGSAWSALPGPLPAAARYRVQHGFGYSRFSHVSHELDQDVLVYVPRHDPVKITRVRIANRSGRQRHLSLSSLAQLVLGGTAVTTRASIVTSHEGGIIFATNSERGEFSARVAFAYAVCEDGARISAMAGPDPSAILELAMILAPGATVGCAFMLGEAADLPAARACIERYRSLESIDAAYDEVTGFWRDLLARVSVRTPSRALDIMLNGWLAYQNLACRMWARSAFHQSGGAFGFRDQLQDSSALLYLDPGITRAQILLHAAHQFVEGDVLHWWHPPASKGIRTRFSDDLLWLPLITLFYVERTADRAIFDEDVRFLTAELLDDHEDERFLLPVDSKQTGSLYEHCCRAIDRSLTQGAHGLPLMGSGDWNDGMNRVGKDGRGESVWLGFFLYDILEDFIPLCEQRADSERLARYREYQARLHNALNQSGWDGEWYRRAYYDDGTPLGSAQNDECRIDALAQAWSVISGVAPPERAQQAMAAVQEHLISRTDGIVRLLTPPFDRTPHDPGYIKGYVPGVRENGGQYTHAAMWVVRALAELGLREHAAAVLEMLSPITRAAEPAVYRGEPYVVAADVYGEPPHVGRAGWTWYTGSAGWMYRVLLESLLGFDLRGDVVLLKPCLPASWPGFTLRYRFAEGTVYTFEVELSNETSGPISIPIERDGGEHIVHVRAGLDAVPRYSASVPPLLRTTSAKK